MDDYDINSSQEKEQFKRKLSSSSESFGTSDELELALFHSESESDSECETWDEDCTISLLKPQKSLIGYHAQSKETANSDNNHNKKPKLTPELSPTLLHNEFKEPFKNNWSKSSSFTTEHAELITEPFNVCVIKDFLQNPKFLTSLEQEFNDLDWNVRSMDLYEFFQSKDLKFLSKHCAIDATYQFLRTQVKDWVAELTGLNLTHISATCSFYSNTDYLLLHDDQREDRMVAFILYFQPEVWPESKGGALELFSKSADGQPLEVARKILPKNNQFVFFPVTNDSYHQVAEITTLSECRCSINGWFHTKTPPIYETPQFTPRPGSLFSCETAPPIDYDIELESWLTEEYLKCETITQIHEYFEQHSEICLKEFFNDKSFEALTQILMSQDLECVKIGPPNRYNYEIVETANLPDVLERFLSLFRSKQMFALLQRCTGLNLTAFKFELQKWTPGCYSLLAEYDWMSKKELDLMISFGCKNNSDVIGARTQYVTIDEEIQNALITIDPEENNLNMIYRDTARFTKYYSKQSRCSLFYTLVCSYTE